MMAMSEDRGVSRARGVGTIAIALLLSLVVLVSIGAIGGAVAAWVENPANWGKPTLAIAGAALVCAMAVLGLLRFGPRLDNEGPVSPKIRKARNLLLLSAGLGAVIGAGMSLGTISLDDPFALFSNGPMPLVVVVPALAVFLLVVPAISWQWHRSVDEHEAQSYKFGGLAALYLYAYLAPAWWLAWRGGLVPAPDSMILYLIVITVWCVGWFWRRYR